MNIIELFENAGIYRENLSEFTVEDTVKAKKQFDIELAQKPGPDPNLANNLILAMNDFSKELLFISNNRRIYNLFAKKNHSRYRFSSDNIVTVSNEDIKAFIDRFLSEDLDLFFDQKMAQNQFEDIDDLLEIKEYLPQNSLDKLNQKISEKFDFILSVMNEGLSVGDDEYMSIYFIRFSSFYLLVSKFRSPEFDTKIRLIYDKMSGSQVKAGVKSMFLNPMIIAMGNYNALDVELDKTLKKNKEAIESIVEKSESRGSGMSTWSIIAIIIVVIRVILLMARLGRA